MTLTILLLLGCRSAAAQVRHNYQAAFTANAGSSELAPYYIASNREGTVTQQYGAQASASLWHDLDTTRRMSWGYRAQVWAGAASSAAYARYDATLGGTAAHSQHPARVWLHTLSATGKYRSVVANLGSMRHRSPIVDDELSSGDLTLSPNARRPMGVQVGFVGFQPIPHTNGWLQIDGDVGYYKIGDDNWLRHHYNYQQSFVTTGAWYHYKRAHFRTNPNQPLVATVGMQHAVQFGGKQVMWKNGEVAGTNKMQANLKAFFRCMVPGSGGSSQGDSYVEGNHLGTWDVALAWNMPGGQRLRGYYQSPFEDGSAIGKLNGFDGLWGVEFSSGSQGWLEAAVLEYADLTNQSGPIHWAPNDHSGTAIAGNATGMDDYYNNYAYNGYASRGMSLGSPFVRSTLYNTDGYLRYSHNLMRGFHLAARGHITPALAYRAMVSYRRAWGTPEIPLAQGVSDTSVLLEGTWQPAFLPHLTLKAALACDWGKLYHNNVGSLVSISYHGNFSK